MAMAILAFVLMLPELGLVKRHGTERTHISHKSETLAAVMLSQFVIRIWPFTCGSAFLKELKWQLSR